MLQKEWRDCTKAESSPDHWVEANRNREIAAFYLALPDDVLMIFEISIFEKMTVVSPGHVDTVEKTGTLEKPAQPANQV